VLYEDLQKADDFVVIACDGIWECMNNEQVSDYIYDKIRNNSSITLQQIVDDMFEKNVAKSIECENGCDNMTCIIIQFKK
jgi:protein phosphatase 1G